MLWDASIHHKQRTCAWWCNDAQPRPAQHAPAASERPARACVVMCNTAFIMKRSGMDLHIPTMHNQVTYGTHSSPPGSTPHHTPSAATRTHHHCSVTASPCVQCSAMARNAPLSIGLRGGGTLETAASTRRYQCRHTRMPQHCHQASHASAAARDGFKARCRPAGTHVHTT
jgi:hypothetical protein